MEKWIFIVTSIILFKLSFEFTNVCKRKSISGGEELVCRNASSSIFHNSNLYTHRLIKITCDNCTIPILDSLTFNLTKTNINFLYFTSSQIHTLKEFAFSKLKNLRTLNLRNNSVFDLDPKCFTNLIRLAHLDLSYNSIRILINSMFEELPNLNLLNLDHNHIYYLQPDAFKGLTHLRHLYLNNNRIEKLDGFIFKFLPNLALLYLENNNIHEIDSFAFTNLVHLNSLYLNHNKIRFLTQYNFKPLSSLVDLQLRDNNLTEIQVSAFNGLTNLKLLYLGDNHLKIVKRYGFVGLNNLRVLELINNDFEIFDLSYIENMKFLNMLWLQENRISNFSIDYKMEILENLTSLGLNDNNLTVLNFKFLYNKMPNLQYIFIYNNSWKCELLVNMFNFFEEKNVSLCASSDCNVNNTKLLIQDSCISDEEEKEEIETDFVTDGASLSFSLVLVFLVCLPHFCK